MDVVVIEQHTSEYPNPIVLNQGDRVALGEMDDEFPNWIFVTTEAGVKGWAPIQYIDKSGCGSEGTLLHDYDAWELNTVVGEKLTVLFELNAWYRASRTNGETGWVPVRSLQPAWK